MTNPFQKENTPGQPLSSPAKRIVSIDALRGFTMLFIIGGGGFFISFHEVWPNSFTESLAKNMEHAGWEGFYFLDLSSRCFCSW